MVYKYVINTRCRSNGNVCDSLVERKTEPSASEHLKTAHFVHRCVRSESRALHSFRPAGLFRKRAPSRDNAHTALRDPCNRHASRVAQRERSTRQCAGRETGRVSRAGGHKSRVGPSRSAHAAVPSSGL